jgi:hypothetical protein
VLATAYARLQANLSDVPSIRRLAFDAVPFDRLPEVQLIDGAETRPYPGEAGDNVGTPDFVMRFAVALIADGDVADDVPPQLNALRAAAIAALVTDPETSAYEPTFGGLLQWLTCTGVDTPVPLREPGDPLASMLVHFAAARPEAEMNPMLQAGF